jgi:iron complex transport system substrate-binding protein
MKMKLFIFSILLLTACGPEKGKEEESISDLHSSHLSVEDHFLYKVEVQYARHFSVSYHGNYKVVKTNATLGNWDASSTDRQQVEDILVLVQAGTPAPPLTSNLAGASIITIPANTVASNNAATEIWLEMLDLSSQQVAVGGTKTYNDDTRSAVENKKLGQLGYFWSEPPNMEVLLQRDPDLLLATISQIRFNQALSKIRSLDVSMAPIFDWAERDYLGRAEWIKYISLFFNEEKKANELFEDIERHVNELRALVDTLDTKPSVIWGNYVDSGFWMGKANNAEAQLLKDAGTINPIEDFTLPFSPVGEPFTSEEWLQVGQDIEHWIISGGTTSVRLPSEHYLSGFRAWRENNLYHHYRRSKPQYDVYDWYNLGIVRPDWVLADLIALFHPELLPDHELIFFGNYLQRD